MQSIVVLWKCDARNEAVAMRAYYSACNDLCFLKKNGVHKDVVLLYACALDCTALMPRKPVCGPGECCSGMLFLLHRHCFMTIADNIAARMQPYCVLNVC